MLAKLGFVFLAIGSGLSPGASIISSIEGGSLGKVTEIASNHFRLAVIGETDQAGRNRQASWYYFRVEGAPKTAMIFDMVDLPGEYNFQPNKGAITDKTPPVISYDLKTWTHLTDVSYDAKGPKLTLRIVPKSSKFWIAHTPPYTGDNLASLRSYVVAQKDARETVIGKSPKGAALYLWSIGNPDAPKTVWLMFRQHSWESGSSWVGEGVVRALLSAELSDLRNEIQWKIIPMCDPDGVARGGVRFNYKGYDLNRNWDVVDPEAMPEITAQRKAVADWIRSGKKIDFFFSLHNTETSEYLEGPPGGDKNPAVKGLAEHFFDALKRDTSFDPSRPLFFSTASTTEGMKGRMNVIQGLHRDFGVPGFLMENRIGFHAKLSGFPGVPDRLEFGRKLPRVIAAALQGK
jgi:hypothetical protein